MYTVSQAAALSGVSKSTLRAWERRYGIIHPSRTEGGYRLYDAGQVALLREMAARVEGGMRAAQAAASLAGASLDGRQVGGHAGRPDGDDHADGHDRVAFDLVEAVVSLDPRRLADTVDGALDSREFEQVVRTWLMPQLHRIGQAWARGEISVAQEHQITAELMRALSHLFHEAPDRGGPTALVGLPPGARHELALLAFATCLRRLGSRVIYLGADLPPDDWRAAAIRSQARVAVVGAHCGTDAAGATEVAAALADLSPLVPVWSGGSAARQVTGASPLPDDVVEAAHHLHRALLGGRA
ncbi:MerR family transcriptional regulator [Aestuariimicrobium sp. T2.26MG-19.2B]|uniref:MerR family transcriptional regulator n=1 Tax=Aestuariimicrobium sp. T2.26MG-19.2B TaxID=3040679 RepID=UPI002477A155|nr:MerR family transcriptional regulator [Aestuariimicrobium sp. T2.26MG-19.2B]CAI9401991.1 HTH-type transcriptional repressor CarH [Aestuariimicrobium sp. T2.26MG-19.2B]